MEKIKYFVKEITWLNSINNKGWGNGYACIPPGHPLHGKDYNEIDVDIHGGLTFSDSSNECDWPEIPEECKKDHWIVGFDCAHYGDDSETCPQEFVEQEAANLAEQLQNYKV